VAYVLTPEKVDGQAERPGVFRADAEFVRGYSTNQDYKLSGFDRGHLAPSADFAWSEEAIRSTYLLSNVVPQYPALNRGRWAQLERAVRNHAREADSVMVVSGVLFASGQRLTIGPNRVAVPSFLFKVFLVVKNGRKYAYGAIIPNDPVVTEPLDTFQRSIDEIEERTGLDFFSHLDDAEEEALESCMPSGMNAMRPAPPE
jgi:endonuclease G